MNELELTDDELESLKDLLAYVGGRIPDDHYAQRENFNTAADALDMSHLNRLDVPDGWRVETDGGEQVEEADDDRDLPTEFGLAGQEAGRPVDILDYVEAGDRILWGDRSVPCVVARVVEPDDPIGQSLTASVIRSKPPGADEDRPGYTVPEYGRDLRGGDVFMNPDAWGNLTGKKFVLIQGPRGGFYAVTRDERNARNAVLFRAVRSYHKTKLGQSGQGAFAYEGAFDEGLQTAVNRAAREFSELVADDEEAEEGPWADVPAPEKVSGTPSGYSHSTVVVEEIVEDEYGLKAVLDGPAPWETPDDETPLNEALKSTPWEENHRTFDSEREAWTVDADELTATASTLRDYGYSVRCEYDLPE